VNFLRTRSLKKRKERLERALPEYPPYDPPHKVEERLLSRMEATQNFDYFMRVRLDRLAYFRTWLEQQFGFKISFDEPGVRELSRWGNEYAGFLLPKGPGGHPTMSYFDYDPPWTAENAGLNVLFDMGITFGEAIVANCPNVHWDIDPVSALLPATAKLLKQTAGTSFQRPSLTGFDNPVYEVMPLHRTYLFAVQMMRSVTTVEGATKFHQLHRRQRRRICDQLIDHFSETLRNYPEGDPAGLRQELGDDAYLKLVDSESKPESLNQENTDG
jgi:hypothetical protein